MPVIFEAHMEVQFPVSVAEVRASSNENDPVLLVPERWMMLLTEKPPK